MWPRESVMRLAETGGATPCRERNRMKRETSLLCAIASVAILLAACSSGGKVTLAGGQPAQGLTTDFGVAYIKRQLPADPVAFAALQNLDDLRHQRPFWSKADVFIRDIASGSRGARLEVSSGSAARSNSS